MLSNLFYYVFFSSALLVYGVGLNRSVVVSSNIKHLVLDCVKMLIEVSSVACLTYLTSSAFLIRIGLIEIYPFISVLFFVVISGFIESIVRITANVSMTEYAVPLLCIILAVNESVSLGECVVNACYCVFSYYICIPFLYAIRKNIERSRPFSGLKNLSLLFMGIAIILLIIMAGDVSILNLGGLK